MKIIVDCMGGDNSPDANVEGAILALRKFSDLSVILTVLTLPTRLKGQGLRGEKSLVMPSLQ